MKFIKTPTFGGTALQTEIAHIFYAISKLSALSLKNNMINLKQIVFETQKWSLEFFSMPSDSWVIDLNICKILFWSINQEPHDLLIF